MKMNNHDRDQARKMALIEREEKSIAAARQMAKWQIQASYYLAMLNNSAMKNGRQEIHLILVPGDPPTLKQVDKK